MTVADATEFPFVADLPKREQKKVRSVLEQWREFKVIVESKGHLIPPSTAAQIASVTRGRIYQLMDVGTLEVVRLQGHCFVTEASFTAWITSPRKDGRPAGDGEPSGRLVNLIRKAAKK